MTNIVAYPVEGFNQNCNNPDQQSVFNWTYEGTKQGCDTGKTILSKSDFDKKSASSELTDAHCTDIPAIPA